MAKLWLEVACSRKYDLFSPYPGCINPKDCTERKILMVDTSLMDLHYLRSCYKVPVCPSTGCERYIEERTLGDISGDFFTTEDLELIS